MTALSMTYVFGTPARPTSASNQQAGGHTRSQADLKSRVKEEVRGAVFELKRSQDSEMHAECVITIMDAFYGTPTFLPRLIATIVLEDLEPRLAALEACRFKEERAAYKPLADLFNHILSALPKGTITCRFYVYDVEMKGKVDGSGNQKPDLLALLFRLVKGQRVLWRQVRIAVEVKGDLKEGVNQALTYTRSMLAMGDKWFAPALVYNHRTGQLCSVFATRVGVFVTPAINLLNAHANYSSAAEMVIRMCVAISTDATSSASAGYDGTRRMDTDGKLCISLPTTDGPAWFKLHDISHRLSLLGRGTQVSIAKPLLEKLPDDEPAATDPNAPDAAESLIKHDTDIQTGESMHVPMPRRSTRTTSGALAKANNALRRIHRGVVPDVGLTFASAETSVKLYSGARSGLSETALTSSNPDNSSKESHAQRWATDLGQSPEGDPPCLDVSSSDQLIIKSSWQPYPGHDTESKTVKKMENCHGCPVYAGDLTVPHPLAPLARLISDGHFCVSQLLEADERAGQDAHLFIQPRMHKVLATKSPGIPFCHLASKPKRLGRALKDVIIGLYVSHRSKISHRDVTNGNLLGAEEPKPTTAECREQTRKILGDRLVADCSWMTWMLIFARFTQEGLDPLLSTLDAFVNDFEHAINWTEAYRERSFARSGTPEFMSVQQLLVLVEERIRAHSTVDDFESCIWVALYNVLYAYVHRHSRAESEFFQAFSTDEYGHLLGQKFRILQLSAQDKQKGSALSVTWALWSRLLPIANEAQIKLGNLMAKYLQTNEEEEATASQVFPAAEEAREEAEFPTPPESDSEVESASPRPSVPAPGPKRDDPENPMFTPGSNWAAAQKERLDAYHDELRALTDEVFYKYMHAIKDALELLPEQDEEIAADAPASK